MRSRVIFLDIDGVLNNASDWFALPIAHGPGCHKGSRISPIACGLVDRLARELDADIVISSTWRIGRTVETLAAQLAPFGLDPERIIGKTPNLDGAENDQTRTSDGLIVCYSNRRGREIRAWMVDHGLTDDQVVILDDDSDMGDLLPRLVKTSWSTGLDRGHVLAALSLFPTAVQA